MTGLATARGRLEIRELHTLPEFEAAERIQSSVWGEAIIPTPKEMLIPIQHEGGLLAGAFTLQNLLVGLVFSFPTRDPAAHHSQMLATVAEWRGLGIGARLKWFQREWCLERGIRLVRWTVDPLRAANAWLNIHLLGATAAAYLPDYYGRMQGIDAGAPTDRLLVEWRLDSRRVSSRVAGPPTDRGFPAALPMLQIRDGKPVDPRENLENGQIRMPLPGDFIILAKNDPGLASSWRLTTRALFQAYLARGYIITGFTRLGGPAYLFARNEDRNED